MRTYAASIAFGIAQGWLRANPPLYMPKRIGSEEQKRRNRACMQRLRDARRAQGLNAAGKPFTYSAKNKRNRKQLTERKV